MQAVHPSAVVAHQKERSRSGLQRVGGAAGVIFGAVDVAVAGILIISLTRSGLTHDLGGKEGQFADYLHGMLPALLPLMFLETVAAILALVFVRAIDERLRPLAPTASSVAALFGYAGLVILMLDFASFVALEQGILGGNSRDTVVSQLPAWNVLTQTSGVVGGLLVVSWMLMINWIAARRGGYPRVLGYVGLLAAAVAFVGLMLSLHGFTHILVNLWEITLGVVLWRGATTAAATKAGGRP